MGPSGAASSDLFLVPGCCYHQFSSTPGNQPARLLHVNYLPLAPADPAFHFFTNDFANDFRGPPVLGDAQLYSEAKVGTGDGPHAGMSY